MSDLTSLRPAGAAARRRERIGLGFIFVCVAWAYFYIGLPPSEPIRFVRESDSYYHQLVDGFLAGRLSLKKDPPRALTELADPYDPAQRAQAGNVGLHDAVYYKGRYYLYFGVAPAVVLLLPFKLLTGLHFPQALATVLFCVGGYGCSLGLFLAMRRRFFPRCSTSLVWAGALALGFGNFCLPMLARNAVWELPIASAYFHSCLGLWLLFLGWPESRRRGVWLLLASVAWGLAVASRPHFVLAVAGFGLIWLALWTRRIRGERRFDFTRCLREAVVLFGPLALIGVGLLVYNYQRFGNPLDFGIRYQLGGYSVLNLKLMSWKFIPINFYVEFLAPAQIERYFPFFHVIRGYEGVRPQDWGGAEDPYGVLTNLPFVWLGLLAPLLWVVNFRAQREVGGWLLLFGLGFCSVAFTVLCFGGACNRYMVDFLPMFLLLSTLGLLMADALRPSFGLNWPWRTALIAVAVYAAFFNLGIAIRHNGLFKIYRPQTFAVLARFFNAPVLWWENHRGEAYGPVELTVRFPNNRPGQAEPLLVSGVSYLSDYIHVYYFPDGRRIQLGFTHTNGNHLLSQPIPVDYHLPHRIGIEAGSLYPPAWHPYFSGRPAEAVRLLKESLRVTLDGVPYLLQADQKFYDTTPGHISFGRNHSSDYGGRAFTGELLAVRRQALPPALAPFPGGSFLRLALKVPEVTTVRREVLVTTGELGQRDFLFIDYLSGARVRLGFQHEGTPPLLSEELAVAPHELQLLEASLGSFYPHPANARERELALRLMVNFNGEPVWDKEQAFHGPGTGAPVVAEETVVARQAVQLFPAQPDLPFEFLPYWRETGVRPSYGAIRLHVRWPRDVITMPEPLMVIGETPLKADHLIWSQPVMGKIQLTYIHSGEVPAQSRLFAVDLAQPHLVEIDGPSLYPAENSDFFASQSLSRIRTIKSASIRVKFDEKPLLERKLTTFFVAPEHITIGEDKIATTFARRFTGDILGVERLTFSSPQGFTENTGLLELSLTFPAETAMKRETLLATGSKTAADILNVVYEGADKIHFAIVTARGDTLTSAAVAVDGRKRHSFRVAWGGLYPEAARPSHIPAAQWSQRQRQLEIWLDDVLILKKEAHFATDLTVQPLSLGSMNGQSVFSGLIHEIRRLPDTR